MLKTILQLIISIPFFYMLFDWEIQGLSSYLRPWGLLLFCLYINDIKDYLSNSKALRLLYADDLQIYIQVPANETARGINLLFDLARMVTA